MIYKAKKGSKAYEYIKSICEAEDKEFKAYVKRVEDSVGFEFDKFGGCMPSLYSQAHGRYMEPLLTTIKAM